MTATYTKEQNAAYMRAWHQRHPGYNAAQSAKWRMNNPEQAKASNEKYEAAHPGRMVPITRRHTLARYGLVEDDYAALFTAQGGVCAICSGPPEDGKAFHVDHDHVTGEVRGLLCFLCNTGLGMFRDTPEYLLTAIDYLALHEEKIKSNGY